MPDFYILTTKKKERHLTLSAAEAERDRLSAKHPEKQFRILRSSDNLHRPVGRAEDGNGK